MAKPKKLATATAAASRALVSLMQALRVRLHGAFGARRTFALRDAIVRADAAVRENSFSAERHSLRAETGTAPIGEVAALCQSVLSAVRLMTPEFFQLRFSMDEVSDPEAQEVAETAWESRALVSELFDKLAHLEVPENEQSYRDALTATASLAAAYVYVAQLEGEDKEMAVKRVLRERVLTRKRREQRQGEGRPVSPSEEALQAALCLSLATHCRGDSQLRTLLRPLLSMNTQDRFGTLVHHYVQEYLNAETSQDTNTDTLDTKTLDTKTLDTKTLDTKTLDTRLPETHTQKTHTQKTHTQKTHTQETHTQEIPTCSDVGSVVDTARNLVLLHDLLDKWSGETSRVELEELRQKALVALQGSLTDVLSSDKKKEEEEGQVGVTETVSETSASQSASVSDLLRLRAHPQQLLPVYQRHVGSILNRSRKVSPTVMTEFATAALRLRRHEEALALLRQLPRRLTSRIEVSVLDNLLRQFERAAKNLSADQSAQHCMISMVGPLRRMMWYQVLPPPRTLVRDWWPRLQRLYGRLARGHLALLRKDGAQKVLSAQSAWLRKQCEDRTTTLPVLTPLVQFSTYLRLVNDDDLAKIKEEELQQTLQLTLAFSERQHELSHDDTDGQEDEHTDTDANSSSSQSSAPSKQLVLLRLAVQRLQRALSSARRRQTSASPSTSDVDSPTDDADQFLVDADAAKTSRAVL
ncbi:MAG: hypothetical protein MHM6MM_000403 [Cercozoa sp. M6MM]